MLREFEDYMRLELNRSRLTVEAYSRDISQFAAWLGGETFDPASATTADIRAWLGSMAREDSPVTLRRKAQSLRAFYRWLLRRGSITFNPAADIILAKAPKRLPEFVKEQEIEAIVKNGDISDFRSHRAHIAILML